MTTSLFWKTKLEKEGTNVVDPFLFQNGYKRVIFQFPLLLFLYIIIKFTNWTGDKKREHIRALLFLKKRNLLKEYTKILKRLHIRSTMDTIRYYWYAKVLLRYTVPERIIEIGPAAGGFAIILSQLCRIEKYVLIDFPVMLEAAKKQINQYSKDAHKFIYLPPDRINLISPAFYDLVCNFNSFSEMDQQTIKEYIDFTYNALKPGGVFYHVNRIQVKLNYDGSKSFNNPLTFPYHKDQILFYEPDEFHHETRSIIGKNPTWAIIRISKI